MVAPMSLLSEPGDLARTPLAAVLLEALQLGASGVLEIEDGGGRSRLWFHEGRPVGAQVVAGFRPLGIALLQAGLIDVDALSRSLAIMAATGRAQGEILVELGCLSRAEVDRALAEQQAGYLARIAGLDAGTFRFDPSAQVPAWTRGSGLPPLRAVVDALARPQADALVVEALRPAVSHGVRLAPGYREAEDGFGWTGPERALLERLEPAASLETCLGAPGVASERARAMIAALLLLGLAVPDTEPIAPARQSDPAESRARRQRLLHQAMRNMGIGPFAGARPPPAPAAASAVAPAASPLPSNGAHPGVMASPTEDALREALLAIAPRARERDLFARLGLPDTAARDDVRRVFLQLARRFHPDRFAGPALQDLAETVRDFFTAVNHAYQVLSDDHRRAEYLASRRDGKTGAPAVQVESARVDFSKGEACLRTRDWTRARGFYESALRADRRPEHLAALAYTFLADPKLRDLDRARALLEEATRDPHCDRAQYVSGLLARDEGDDLRAERMFRAAAAANPRAIEPLRELRALDARRRSRRSPP
jgi:tetratricopeptide (TPR) repeat protein